MMQKRRTSSNSKDDLSMMQIVDALPRAVLVIGNEGRITFANAEAEVFFQTGAANLKRRTIAEIVPFASPLVSLVEKVRNQGWRVHEYGLDLGTPRTGGRPADAFGAPILDQPGTCILVLEERSLAETFDRRMSHRNAARSIGGMAGVLAHEIKNPLAGIRGAAQLLEGVVPETDVQLTQLICQETDRIAKLVDKMAAFGARGKFDRSPVNIHDVLDHVHRLAVSSFGRGIKIVEIYDPSLPPVSGDRDALVQVLLNLIRNAVDAVQSADDPCITLRTAYKPGVRVSAPGNRASLKLPLEVTVTDNGSGISEDLMPFLFDPFVTTKAGGTGLGLALVSKIVDEHGGIVDCTSQPGETTFRLLLPIETGTRSMEKAAI